MKKKVIFLDVDGTIVANHSKISDLVKAGINKARANGHLVFICTGRNKAGIRSELNEIKFDGFVASAGNYVEIDNQVIFSGYFSDELVNKASKVFNECNILYNYECTDVTFMTKQMLDFFVEGAGDDLSNSELDRLKAEQEDKFNTRDMSLYDHRGVHKMSFIALCQEDYQNAYEQLKDDFNFIVHEIFGDKTINGEIISKTANKGTGVQAVVEYLNMNIDDTIGFGDSMNDYEMIVACNQGIVMANGSEQLKAVASSICKSVDEDGVYYKFIDLGLIEG